ncbi:MAG: acyloxyacyl hydrolase [Gammaproteobacteria bacterium]|nr:acyloxyacyl hydrolase [Gammaproteobacteria bacterium]
MRLYKTLLIIFFLLLSFLAQAGNGINVMGGEGNADTRYAGISWQWDMTRRWFTDGGWEVAGFWEFNLSHWKRDNDNTAENDELNEMGITPVFRLQRKSPLLVGLTPYFEGGIGVHLISDREMNGRDLSSSFQFGEHIGLGVMFGKNNEFDLGYRLHHLSNGGIKQPNAGMTFHVVRFGYRYQ